MDGLFSPKHIIGLVWVGLFVLIMLLLTIRVFKGQKKTIIKIGALVLLALEIIKDLYLVHRDGGLEARYLPIQFSSLSIYIFPIIAFSNGKIAKFVKPFAYAGSLVASLLALFLPTNILGNIHVGWLDPKNFLYTLSFLYHGWVLFVSLYIVLSKYYIPQKHDMWKVVVITIFFATIAGCLNLYLNTDFMMLHRSGGNPLKFLLVKYHFVIYILVQIIIMLVILYIIFLPFKWHKKIN